MIKTACMLIVCVVSALPVFADPFIELPREHLRHNEYYHAITESMRYQYCFPAGPHYAESMIIMSRAYFLGGNYHRAVDIAYDCYKRFTATRWGEQALYNLAAMRLLEGSVFFAYRSYQEYFSMYPEGTLKEHAKLDFIYSKVFLHYYDEAKMNLQDFIINSPDETLRNEAQTFAQQLNEHENRPKKHTSVSLAGSLAVPGFGHFYTGKYALGVLSFLSTTLCAVMAYRGHQDNDNFQLVFFGFMGFTFYQYSLVSAVLNVYEYNSNNELKQAIRAAVQHRF